MSDQFWWRWLVAVTGGVMVFSLSLILLPQTIQSIFNPFFFPPSTRFDADASRYINFLYALLGAVMIGWMVTVLFVLMGAFRRGERAAWNAVTLSIVTWYLIDSSVSILSGFAANAVLNTVFLALFIIPLAATYRQFYRR
jgi:hypothetical protein